MLFHRQNRFLTYISIIVIIVSYVILSVEITKVIFNNPATIVFWEDGSKTTVVCQKNDKYDPEKGLAMAILKKMNGNTGSYYKVFKKWLLKEEKDNVRKQ